ncbi:zinc finger protein, partial [Clarias magur]
MHHTLSGATVSALYSPTSDSQHGSFTFRKLAGIKDASTALLKPSDPIRQAKRLPIKVVKMLTAHSGHLLHPEYLQPLTSAPVSIE